MMIIKIGGGKSLNLPAITVEVARLWQQGQRLIVVHGAGWTRDKVAAQLGVKVRLITSPSGIESVFSDKDLMRVFLMTYAGLVNKQITALLIGQGVKAVGLTGVDGLLWQAKRQAVLYDKQRSKTKLVTGNYAGRVVKVNAKLINLLMDQGYLPVITAPAVTPQGEIVNTDNDTAIAAMAKVLPVTTIVSLFEAPGFLADPDNPESLIKQIDKDKLPDLLPMAKGRMKKKVLGAIKAFEYGVKRIYWGDGRVKQPISSLFQGAGSVIE